MVKRIGIILFFLAGPVGARHAVPLQGLPLLSGTAFADSYTQDGKPCPPECVSDSMEIVTWYPSPYNEYEELRLYPISDSNSQCNSDNRGLMYYDSDEDKVKLCKGPAGLNNWQDLGGQQMTFDAGVCGADNKGEIAYDVTQKQVQFCDGTNWLVIASTVLPYAPTLLSVQWSPGPNVLLKWSASSQISSPEIYKIYRKQSSAGSYSLLASVSSFEYTDAAVTIEYDYYYKLKAVNSIGESVFSNEMYSKKCVADNSAIACNSNTELGYYWQVGGKVEKYGWNGLGSSGVQPVCDEAHLNTTAETGTWNGGAFWTVMTDWWPNVGGIDCQAQPCGVYAVTCKKY